MGTSFIHYHKRTHRAYHRMWDGLYYFGARYYDPDLGMWTSVDPKREFPSPYEYAGNNPVNRTDPDGRADDGMPTLNMSFEDMVNTVFPSWFQSKQFAVGLAKGGLDDLSQANTAFNVATNIAAVADPDPASKVAFFSANTVSSFLGLGIDVAQYALDPSNNNAKTIGIDAGGFLLGRVIGGVTSSACGAWSETADRFRNLATGQFSSTSVGIAGQNINGISGAAIDATGYKLEHQ